MKPPTFDHTVQFWLPHQILRWVQAMIPIVRPKMELPNNQGLMSDRSFHTIDPQMQRYWIIQLLLPFSFYFILAFTHNLDI
uniref:Uncharacterized protein n=1 Tax=Rhizophora mucronata TaxID=61149 RepID=A0A2P2L285_RHIMU